MVNFDHFPQFTGPKWGELDKMPPRYITTDSSVGRNEKRTRRDLDKLQAVRSISITQTQKIPAPNEAASDAGVEKVGTVSFVAMPMADACNLAIWRRAVWSKRDSQESKICANIERTGPIASLPTRCSTIAHRSRAIAAL